jgi:hypothetical protein
MTARWQDGKTAGSIGAIMLLVGLALLSTGRALGNGFAFDDVPIILENDQIHQLAWPWTYAQQSYWPPKNLGDAYRPWTVWWLALQWAIGGGVPWVFHLGNLVLTLCVTLLVFRLARELLPPFGAVVAAAFFAVHPVHVEATANVVGQGELWMTGFTLAACLAYLRARRSGSPNATARLALAGLLVLAAASKEQGIVLPGLLVALEWLAVGDPTGAGLRARTRSLLPTYALVGLTAVGFLGFRYGVLGDLGGGPPAAGLDGLGLMARAEVMLPLAPTLARLLVWPMDLLAQYSPPAQGLQPLGADALLGVALVLGAAIAVWLTRRRQPVLALGLAWLGIGLLPVSNIPFPTGVLIAERTLLLPSVGVVLIGGWLAEALGGRSLPVAIAAVVGVVAAGAARSWSRQPVWRDNLTLFTQTVVDEPRSYRGHFVLGRELVRRNDPEGAIAAYRRAGDLYQGDHRVFEEWGQVHRAASRCDLAVPVFERGVAANPTATVARSRLFECLYWLGDYDRAAAVATEGLRLGGTEFKAAAERAAKAKTGLLAPPATTR